MDERQDYIIKIIGLAKARGLCKTQKEFAQLLGIDPTGLSLAVNGNPRGLTNSLVGKIRAFSMEHGLETGTPAPKPGGVYLPPETLELFNNLSETLRLQAELLARQTSVLAPKNTSLENKWR